MLIYNQWYGGSAPFEFRVRWPFWKSYSWNSSSWSSLPDCYFYGNLSLDECYRYRMRWSSSTMSCWQFIQKTQHNIMLFYTFLYIMFWFACTDLNLLILSHNYNVSYHRVCRSVARLVLSFLFFLIFLFCFIFLQDKLSSENVILFICFENIRHLHTSIWQICSVKFPTIYTSRRMTNPLWCHAITCISDIYQPHSYSKVHTGNWYQVHKRTNSIYIVWWHTFVMLCIHANLITASTLANGIYTHSVNHHLCKVEPMR